MISTARLIATSAAGLTLASAGPATLHTAPSSAESGYAPVNGLHLYYEIRGTGAPVVVLHGGLSNTELIAGMITQLARTQRVIAGPTFRGTVARRGYRSSVHLRGDGGRHRWAAPRSQDPEGGHRGILARRSVALRTAIQHPDMIGKLVVVSAVVQPSGWYPELHAAREHLGAGMAEAMKPSPAYQTYARIAPRPEDWPVLLEKTGALLRQDFDWTHEVKSIAAPTLLVFGDADAIRPEHMVEFFHLLGGGTKDGGLDGSGMSKARLAILPGTTHYTIFDSPLLPPLIVRFLASDDSRIRPNTN